ncbi:DSD1 family PLP-dependent enzyme [Novosphingobium terrae]|uniref:DSD1 family PLP-dependent enzyme n=1 Tax=Novosphingobium terrae TaxID=2726189 RepID=UPI00197CED62|nr:DSD1 family PLP-dependent enzyme [Novosphingobium terrae]
MMLAGQPTPALVLDEARMRRNIARLRDRLAPFGVTLRPHVKTAKSIEVVRQLLTDGHGPATVSTLKEAEALFAAGVTDILYAVGIAPHRLERVQALRAQGCDLAVLLDSIEQAGAVVAACAHGAIPVLLEIDSDGHRAGLKPQDERIVAIGRLLVEGGAILRGVLTHAGGSYGARSPAELEAYAEQERAAVVEAAERLRAAGLPCPVVSVGSSPTAHFARHLDGVTEVRAGVYVFFDLVMAGIGVCALDDIALSVLTTVIGHQAEKGWVLCDAGWMALSRDRGTQGQALDQGYGVVCDIDGKPYPDLIVDSANQEHGIIALRPGSTQPLPDLPVGTQLRILPNHACATGAQFDDYIVLPADGGPIAIWPRFRGW